MCGLVKLWVYLGYVDVKDRILSGIQEGAVIWTTDHMVLHTGDSANRPFFQVLGTSILSPKLIVAIV